MTDEIDQLEGTETEGIEIRTEMLETVVIGVIELSGLIGIAGEGE